MLQKGIEGQALLKVEKENCASAFRSGSVQVFATPMLVALMEEAAKNSVEPFLEVGQTTVGTKVDIKHLAASTVGMTVHAESELTDIDRKRLTFSVRAYDEAGLVGEGTHERFIIDIDKFMQKAGARQA